MGLSQNFNFEDPQRNNQSTQEGKQHISSDLLTQQNTLEIGFAFLAGVLAEIHSLQIPHTNDRGVLYGGSEGDPQQADAP